MAFIQAAASVGAREDRVLSADNAVPERHIIIDTLRNAAPLLGINASVIATLDAMLSCLPPRRHHHVVFASNATLSFRRNGISDRTIRRHVAILEDLGLLTRQDSPNKKRFTRRNATEGKTLMFGFDLSLLFERFSDIATLAANAIQEQEQLDYMRVKIRALANRLLQTDPENLGAIDALKMLRRKLTLSDCQNLLQTLETCPVSGAPIPEHDLSDTAPMSGSDGQNVRHHQNSIKENIDTDKTPNTLPRTDNDTLSIPELLHACPEAAQFLLRKIETTDDVISHARTLAPMMGIDARTYQAAQDQLGAVGTATTIWALMQLQHRIHKMGAYFRAITSGAKHANYDPVKLVRQLGLMQDCPV